MCIEAAQSKNAANLRTSTVDLVSWDARKDRQNLFANLKQRSIIIWKIFLNHFGKDWPSAMHENVTTALLTSKTIQQ